ncbi:WD repeat-containing protein 81-like [Antedon mediterranea]|uniref:WD repeat-containing protein 81-like n=1 Tax=Antedon mediterranea TaxID=105859 RepID=UPI003AF91D0D
MESNICIDQISKDLFLDVRLLKSRENGAITAAVPTEWVKQMLQTGCIGTLSASDHQISTVYSVTYEDLPEAWQRLEIKAFQKVNNSSCCIPALNADSQVAPNLELMDWMQTISTKEFVHQWKTNFYKYETLSSMYVKSQQTEVRQLGLVDAIKKVYNIPIIQTKKKSATDQQTRPGHPNIYPMLCAVDSTDVLYLLMVEPKPSLHDSILFSPAMLQNSHAKLLFVIYQLFHAIHHCHANGIPCGNISLRNFELTEDIWLKFLGPNWNSIIRMKTDNIPKNSMCNDELDSCIKNNSTDGSPNHSIKCSDQSTTLENLPKLVQDWVLGHISNFDYLMALNSLTGRELGNPNYHPIFPWVMDFSCPNGGFRDLSKSKYRLNKGDEQLDLTYEASIPNLGGMPSQPRHHISDILSEITYYIYHARRTPKAVLCKHVRSKWVPNEYPVSIQRLQTWTPDECIPEFFSEPNIFRSIHDDLPDLELPTWASSPQEFISQHRRILEGDFVSERLHKWIDLTFGYKLSGNAAVKARNVCLQLVDQHTEPRRHGVLQLFAHPHPKRLTMSRFTSPEAPKWSSRFYWSEFTQKSFKIEVPTSEGTLSTDSPADSSSTTNQLVGETSSSRSDGAVSSKEFEQSNELDVSTLTSQEPFKVVKDVLSAALTGNDDLSSKNPIKKLFRPRPDSAEIKYAPPRPEMMTIVIPEDYKPLAMLDHIESLYTFTGKSLHELPVKSQEHQPLSVKDESDKLLAQEIVMVGCLIAEIVLAPKLQMQRQGVNFDQRCMLLRKLCIREFSDIPRPVQSLLRELLQLDNPDFDSKNIKLVAIKEGYPPPSIGLFLQTHGNFVPFPAYFPAMYELICKVKQLTAFLEELAPESTETTKQQHVFEEIQNIAKFLPKLLEGLTEEGKDLLLPCLIPLFQKEDCRLYAFLLLFNIIGQHLGPEVTENQLCSLLKHMYKSSFKSSNFILIFHKAFLSQLISRFGFECFLCNFVEFLVEVLIGQHACPSFRSETEFPMPVLNAQRQRSFTQTRVSESHDALDYENEEEYVSDDCTQSSSQLTVNDGESTMVSSEMNESSDGYASEEPNLVEENDKDGDPTNQPKDINEPSPRHKLYYDDKAESVKVEEALAIETSVKGIDEIDNSTSQMAPGTTLIDTAMESILWLADKIGPFLTAVHLSKRLLLILEKCFCDQEQLRWLDEDSDSESSSDEDVLFMDKRVVVGDTFAEPVFYSLIHIADIYGEELIFKQYLPYIQTCVASVRKKMNTKSEASLVSCLSLLKFLLPYLNDTQLMEKLKLILQKLLKPIIMTLSSLVINFSGGGHVRSVICFKIVDIVISIAGRIGREMAREHMISLVQQFFLCFSLIHGDGSDELALRHKAYERNTSLTLSTDSEDMYCEIKMDSNTRSYKIGTPTKLENLKGEEENTSSLNTQLGSSLSDQISNSPMSQETLEMFEESEGFGDIRQQLQQSFTPELANAAYIPLCHLIGDIYMSNHIENSDLIWKLSNAHEKALAEERIAMNALLSPAASEGSDDDSRRNTCWFVDIGASVQPSRLDEDEYCGSFGTNVTMTGNRIDISNTSAISSIPIEQTLLRNGRLEDVQRSSSPIMSKGIVKPGLLKKKSDRHLMGTWFKYWQQYIENHDQNLSFCQLKLQSFVGHSGGIRSLHVLDDEQTFFSASKDKTVRVWSLTSHGNGSHKASSRWTYYLHKRAAFSVTFLESVRLAASCDGTVHIWDPFKGAQIRQYDMPRTSATVLVKCPAPSCTLLAGTSDASVRMIDTRIKDMKQEFKVTSGPLGLIRCLAVNKEGNLLGVGLSSGVLSMVDLRTGLLLGGWKVHEGEILQIKAHTDRSFVTSSVDHSMALWRDDGHRLCSFRGISEPVHCFSICQNEIVSGTTSNRIGIYNSISSQANWYNTKIRADVLKGNLSALEILPKQKLFLMASDNSSISLSA